MSPQPDEPDGRSGRPESLPRPDVVPAAEAAVEAAAEAAVHDNSTGSEAPADGDVPTATEGDPESKGGGEEAERQRRVRLARAFGDGGQHGGGDAHDRWLRSQVPPHHGG
jgi:hypothetical protein